MYDIGVKERIVKNFIKLTKYNDSKGDFGSIYLNADSIEHFFPYSNLTKIFYSHCNGLDSFMVKESPDEIMATIAKAQAHEKS